MMPPRCLIAVCLLLQFSFIMGQDDAAYPLPGGTAEDYPVPGMMKPGANATENASEPAAPRNRWLVNDSLLTGGSTGNQTVDGTPRLFNGLIPVSDQDELLIVQIYILCVSSVITSLAFAIQRKKEKGDLDGFIIPPKEIGQFFMGFIWAEAQLENNWNSTVACIALYLVGKQQNGLGNFGMPAFFSPQFCFAALTTSFGLHFMGAFKQFGFQAVIIFLMVHRVVQHFVFSWIWRRFLGVDIFEESESEKLENAKKEETKKHQQKVDSEIEKIGGDESAGGAKKRANKK